MSNARFSFARALSVTGFSLVGCGVWLALAAVEVSQAEDNRAAVSSLASTQAVYLEYRELSHAGTSTGLSLGVQAGAFKKEPALGGRKVVRGTMNFGPGGDQSLPFIWDLSKGRLYLDLNRNQDLTDDAGGVFSCTEPAQSSNYYQTFTNVHLSFKTRTGSHPMLVDLNLYDYNQAYGNVAVRSYWAGKVSLQGREWQLGLVETPSSAPGVAEKCSLLLRPWKERDRALEVQDGSLAAFPFCRSLFFNGQAYHLDCAYVQEGGAPKYRIDLEPRQPELGELKLTGQFIQRLVVTGSKYTVVLDQPEPVVKVPVGSYRGCQVQLGKGGVEAYREADRSRGSGNEKGITIATGKPALLAVGGPLTNTVAANRRGRVLNLSYELVGMGGENYQLLGARRQPEFVAYRAGKKIASGKFEFG
jgi:hypothetical protein